MTKEKPVTLEEAGKKGGAARAAKMTKEERSESARLAAEGRWAGKSSVPRATHEGVLPLGGVDIACYNLPGGRRVLSQTTMIGALGISPGGSGSGTGDRLAKFVAQDRLKGRVSEELVARTERPILFRTVEGRQAYGYDATALAEICAAIQEAHRAGVLMKQQEHVAAKAYVLGMALMKTGIIALVDEATGYQKDRARDELQTILAAYISKGLLPWTRRFPQQFFDQVFRMYGWPLRDDNKRPHPVAHFIRSHVYERLPPGVMDELERLNPPLENGRRKSALHQWLTVDTGHQHLDRQITTVTTLLSASKDMDEFRRLLDRVQPAAGLPMSDALKTKTEE